MTRSNKKYIHGSVARKTAITKKNIEIHKKKLREKTSRQKAANRNKQKALSVSPVYAAFLALVCLSVILVCMQYLKIQSRYYFRQQQIFQMQSQIRTMQDKNNALEYSITGYIDKKHIIQVATKSLGMIKATNGQIKLFGSSESEYIKQWCDFPKTD